MLKTEAKNSTLSAYLTNLWSKYVKINVLFVVFVLLASLTGVFSYTRGRADAVTSSTLNFQARLLSNTGSTVPDGTYNIEFNLYTVASGGTTQWTEDYLNTGTPITIKDGYLSANLGSLTAFPGTINWDQEQWLGMTVRGTGSCVFGSCTPTDSEMTPRFKLTAVPYALKSAVSANVSSSSTNSASVDSNAISVQSGDALGATSNSGNISIDSGTATGTTGTLLFGTTNASALTIGRAGVSTTLQGSVSLTGAGVGLAVTNNATIGGTLGVTSTSTFTGLLTANGGLTIATGYTLTNASSTLLTALAISDLATGGNIGSAASTVDVATTFNINQTTASQAVTIPSPTVTTAGRIIYINNVGSASFTMGSATVATGTSANFMWNGTTWVSLTNNAAAGVTTIGTIDSQTKSANGAVISGTTLVLQNADATNVGLVSIGTQTFAGAKTFNTAATFSAAGTGLSVTNDATVGGTFAVTSTSTFTGLVTANGGITASGANSNINASSNFDTNINTGTSTGTTAIGNSLSTTTILGTTNINATGSANTTIGNGTGTFSLNTSAFDVSTAGALSGITSIGLSGAIAGATSVDTINGLIVNAGALSGITGFTQTSGNFSMSGTGTFGTGTGAISLNGDTTIASGKTLTVTGTGATILGGTLAVTGTQTFTGLGTFNGGLTIATGNTFTNASSTLLTAIAVSDVPSSANIGTAATTVDVATTFNVNQTTASQTLSLPSPTVTTSGRVVYVNNVGSASFIMGGITIAASTGSQAYIWNGTAWTTTTTNIGVTSVGTIDSQTKSANGAVISGTTLVLQNADATNVGLVSIGTQTFAGDKTFTGTLLQKSNSATAFRLQDSTGVYNNLTFDSNSNHLRVYNVAGTRLAYADIYYDDATSSAVFAASAGSTQIGAGTGNVDVLLVNNSEQFHFLHTGTNTPSADVDFYIGRNLSGTSNALNGAIVKIEDQSSFTSGSSAPDVLFINQGNSSATGNLIVAKTGGVTTKFAVTTDGNVTAAGTLVVTGNVTASANLTVGSGAGIGQFTNNGSTVNTTLVKTNFAAGGTIGTAATTVDIYTGISIAQTTASQTLTLPTPTVPTAYGRVLYISNVGTVSFTLLGSLVLPGNTANLVWSNTSGAATWQYAGDGGGSGNYIQNQNAADQTGDSRITGTARANTSVTTPLVDSISGALSIGTTTATGITVGGAATTGTIAIGNAAASTISIGAGAFAHTINVGTDLTTTQAVTVGSSSALSATAIQGGTGASAVSIQAASGGTISLGSAAASTVNVGTGAFAHTIAIGTDATTTQGITIGSISASSATTIRGGTGASALALQAGSGGTITIGASAAATVNIGTGAFAHTIAIGTDATTIQGITIGSSFSTSATTISAGSAGISLNASINSPTNINTGTSTGAITVGNSAAGALSVTTGSTLGLTATGAISVSGSSTFALTSTNLNVTTAGVVTLAGGQTNDITTAITIGPSLNSTSIVVATGGTAGSTSNSGALTLKTGSAGASGASGAVSLQSGNAISANSGTITIQSGSVGTAGTAGNVVLDVGTSISGAPTISIGTSTNSPAKTITIGGSNQTGNIDLGTGTGVQAINLATGGTGAKTVIVGSTASTSALTLQAGTGVLSLQTQGTGGINIGTNAVAQVITLGNSTGATQVVLNAGTAGINIGSNGIANTLQIGNTTGAVAQTINIGNNATASSTNTVVVGSTVAGAVTLQSATDVNINAPSLVTNATTLSVFNTNATTITEYQAGTSISIGATTGTLTVRNANQTFGNAAGSGLFTNNGATLNTTLQIADVAAGGAIGTAAATVDIYTGIAVLQTTAGRTLTIPSPTSNPTTVFGRTIYLANIGTTSFTLGTTTVNPGTTATLVWSNTDGAATTGESWQFAGADGNGILNQNTADQTANFRISGTGRANTSVTTPLVDSITGALSIGTSTATGITVGGASTTGAITVGAGGVANTIQIGNSTGAVAQTITLGANATASSTSTVTVGSTIGTSATTIAAGSGAITFNATQAQFSEVTGTRTLTVQTRTGSAVGGSNLTVQAGSSTAAGAGTAGGILTLQGGSANGASASANGGNVVIAGGTGYSTGVKGLVVIDTATYSASTVQNFVASANITQANIDTYGSILISGNVAGWVATLTDPTTTTTGRVVYITNSGSFDITLAANSVGVALSISLKPASTATMFWNGTDWTAAGASSSTDLQAAYNNTATSAGGAELVLNASGGAADGLTVRNNATSPIIGGIFEAQTSVGSNIFSVNNNATEYATNGGAETAGASSSTFPASTWSASPSGGTVTRSLTAGTTATGVASVSVVTTAAAARGARNQLSTTLTNNLKYSVSYSIKADSASSGFTTLDTMFSSDGTEGNGLIRHCTAGTPTYFTGTASQSTTTITGVGTTWTAAMVGQVFIFANGDSALITGFTNATTLTTTAPHSKTVASQSYNIYNAGNTVKSAIWSRISCTFVAPASGMTSANSIFIRQTDATVRTFYIENLSVTVSADVNHAVDGSVDDSTNFATNYSIFGVTGTAARDTSVIYDTSASARVDTPATATRGIRNNMLIAPQVSTQYLVTFYARSTTTMTSTLAAGFLPAGGDTAPTGTAACGDYNTQSLVASTWTKITCIFTTTATAISNADFVVYQTDASARSIYIDALSITLNTNNANNVQIGGGHDGGPITLFTLDRASSAPIAANNEVYLGSMYYDTTSGRIQCYEADGWGACGSAPDNYVNLNPEYAGAVLNGSGVGTMTADFCGNGGGLSVNTSLCASGESRNFYEWTSPQASDQTYSIYVSYQLPATFKGFSSDDTVQLTARTDSLANGSVTYEMFKNESGALTACGTATTVTSIVNTWQTVGVNGNESTSCSFSTSSANAFVIFKINVTAKSNANVYVGTLSFTTTGR